MFDFYTAHKMSQEEFEEIVVDVSLKAEQTINAYGSIRVHVKETTLEAD